MIVGTIRKINKPIFKNRKGQQKRQNRIFPREDDHSSDPDEEMSIEANLAEKEFGAGSEGTFGSNRSLKMVLRISRLEQEIEELKEVAMAMKMQLEYRGIIW